MAIRKLTPEAEAWEAKGNNLVRFEDRDGKPEEIRRPWLHKGVNSKSVAERNVFATDALFAEGQEFVSEWNNAAGFENVGHLTFGGVEFVAVEHGWSKTTGGGLFGASKYLAGGTAVGYLLVPTQP